MEITNNIGLDQVKASEPLVYSEQLPVDEPLVPLNLEQVQIADPNLTNLPVHEAPRINESIINDKGETEIRLH